MDRRRLEATATYLATLLLGALVLLSILAVADGVFDWDVLPPLLDKVAVLVMTATGFLFAGCALLSVMLNLSIVAQKLAAIVDRVERL